MKILPDNIRIYLINQQPLIFTSIKKGSLPEKISFYSVNILGVAVWIYLCKFLFAGLIWILGFNLIYFQWIERNGLEGVKNFAGDTMPFGLSLCLALWLWALFNSWRFRTNKRRQDVKLPSLEQDCLWTTVNPETLAAARTKKNLLCGHTSTGELSSVVAVNPDLT